MNSKLYYLNENKSFSVVKLEKDITHSGTCLILTNTNDLHVKIKDWLARADKPSQTKLSCCFVSKNSITVIPIGIVVKNDELNTRVLRGLNPHENISAQQQQKTLDDFMLCFNKFPKESRPCIIEGALRSVYDSMKARLINDAPIKGKQDYYAECEDSLDIHVYTIKDNKRERSFSTNSKTFTIRVDAFIRDQIKNALESYEKNKIFKTRFIVR